MVRPEPDEKKCVNCGLWVAGADDWYGICVNSASRNHGKTVKATNGCKECLFARQKKEAKKDG